MAISDNGGNTQNVTTNLSDYPFAAFTATSGQYPIVAGAISDTAASITIADTQGITWNKIVDQAYTAGVACKLFCFIADTSPAAASITITVSCTGDAGTGAGMFCRQIGGGRTNLPRHRQVNFGTGAAGTTPTVVLPLAVIPENGVVGFCFNAAVAAPSLTEPSGWTEGQDLVHATPSMGLENCRRVTGETNSTIAWGATSATAWAAIVVELWEATEPRIPRIIHHRNQLVGA